MKIQGIIQFPIGTLGNKTNCKIDLDIELLTKEQLDEIKKFIWELVEDYHE